MEGLKEMSRQRRCFEKLLKLTLLCFLGVANRSHAQTYTVTDLGTLGGSESWAWHVTNYSQTWTGPIVVGWSKNAGGNVRGFYYTSSMASLSTLGGTESTAYDIAEDSTNYDIAGYGLNLSGYSHGVMWDNLSAAVDLGTLTGGNNSVMYGINKNGWRVGRSEVTGGAIHIWLKSKGGTSTDCSTLGGTYGAAQSMNDLGTTTSVGDYVGASRDGSGLMKPFVAYKINSSCTLTTLPALPGGNEGQARDINNTLKIAGFTNNGSATHATYWSGTTPYDVGVLSGGTNSYAYGINQANQVVGASETTGGALRAFIWHVSSGIVDLNTKLPGGSGWVLEYAMSISDDGYIVGRGTHNGAGAAFLLSPP